MTPLQQGTLAVYADLKHFHMAAASQIYTGVTEVRSWPSATKPVLLEELNAKRQHTEMEAHC